MTIRTNLPTGPMWKIARRLSTTEYLREGDLIEEKGKPFTFVPEALFGLRPPIKLDVNYLRPEHTPPPGRCILNPRENILEGDMFHSWSLGYRKCRPIIDTYGFKAPQPHQNYFYTRRLSPEALDYQSLYYTLLETLTRAQAENTRLVAANRELEAQKARGWPVCSIDTESNAATYDSFLKRHRKKYGRLC
jgi:hypothetical protein